MSCDLGLQSIDLGVWPLALGKMHQSLFAKRHLRVAFLFIAERRSTKGGMTVRAPAGGVAGCPWFRVTEHGAIFSAHSAFWGIQVFFFLIILRKYLGMGITGPYGMALNTSNSFFNHRHCESSLVMIEIVIKTQAYK